MRCSDAAISFMRTTSGRSRRPRGYALLALVLLLTGVTMGGFMLLPSRVFHVRQDRWQREAATMETLSAGLVTAVRQTLTIPDGSSWATAVAGATGLNLDAVKWVYPEFRGDGTIQRILMIDPSVASGILPYVQTAGGLVGMQTNLLSDRARFMIVSSTQRGLGLPFADRAPNPNTFEVLWNWVYDPATRAAPQGWPGAWTGRGDVLHVARICLRDLFADVALTHLRYGVGAGSLSAGTLGITNLVLAPASRSFLRGSLLAISQTNGLLHQIRVIRKDEGFNLAPSNSGVEAIAYLAFEENTGATVSNQGSAGRELALRGLPFLLAGLGVANGGIGGKSWDGVCIGGAKVGASGPRPPAFSGLSTNNLALYLDGVSGYVETQAKLPAGLSQFTMGGWIRPKSVRSSGTYAFGVFKVLTVAMRSWWGRPYLQITSGRGGYLNWYYPYGLDSWHHVLVVGTGSEMRLYVDGILRGTRRRAVSDYGWDSGHRFLVGCRPGARGGGKTGFFHGQVDEFVLFDRALSASEVAGVYAGKLPLSVATGMSPQSSSRLTDGFDVVAAE